MARETELRQRVLRLKGGDFRPEDLTRLFLWLRERSRGAATVAEIGDFTAHSGERTKGAVTEEMKAFFVCCRFMIKDHGKVVHIGHLPANSIEVARVRLPRIGTADLRKVPGLKPKAVKPTLESAASKYVRQPDGSYRMAQPLTAQEADVIALLLEEMQVRPAFTEEDVWRDFCFALEREKLLLQGEKRALEHIKPGLMLYAVQAMHQTVVRLEDGWTARLVAGTDADGLLTVDGLAPAVDDAYPSIEFGFPVFTTSLKVADWCEAALNLGPGTTWKCPLEITREPKLCHLQ